MGRLAGQPCFCWPPCCLWLSRSEGRPRPYCCRMPWACWPSCSRGQRTTVHRYLTQHIPLFESFRTPGRIVILIPIVVFPIVAWLLHGSNRRALGIVGAGTLGVFVVARLRMATILPQSESFSPHQILDGAVPSYYDSLILHLLGATALLLVLAALFGRTRRYWLAASLACALGTTWLCLSVVRGNRTNLHVQFRQHGRGLEQFSIAHVSLGDGVGLEMRSVAEYRNRG